MEGSSRTYRSDLGGDPRPLRFTSAYLRRLIIEAPAIMAKLHNPGGSIILTGNAAATDSAHQYSGEIGNDFHLDLIDAGVILKERFSKEEREALYSWAHDLTSEQAATLTQVKGGVGNTGALLRKRRQRAVEKLTRELMENE